jgi:hypothetical protein
MPLLTTTSYDSILAMIPFSRSWSWRCRSVELTLFTNWSTHFICNTAIIICQALTNGILSFRESGILLLLLWRPITRLLMLACLIDIWFSMDLFCWSANHPVNKIIFYVTRGLLFKVHSPLWQDYPDAPHSLCFCGLPSTTVSTWWVFAWVGPRCPWGAVGYSLSGSRTTEIQQHICHTAFRKLNYNYIYNYNTTRHALQYWHQNNLKGITSEAIAEVTQDTMECMW